MVVSSPVNASRKRADVAIVGFGPVGAALAGLLGRRGWDVLVLERERDIFPLPRAAHIDHTGLRTMQELGLLDDLLPTMVENDGLDFVTTNGEVLATLPGRQPSLSGIPASMYFYQPDFDHRVREAALAMPSVEVRRGTTVTGIEILKDGARLVTVDQSGEAGAVEAAWVVGCDGASSLIRERTGLGLEDLEFEEQWFVIDIRLTGDADKIDTRAVCYCDPRRPAYSIPMPERRHRFEFMVMPGEDEAQLRERVAELVAPWVSPEDFELERSTVYMFHGLVASEWRNGPVLIAGDAAHQMPPFLGQGMCSGLRDAENLAWKLDQVLGRGAPSDLLDTYQIERAQHVREIVVAAITYGRLICTTDVDEAALRDSRMLSDPRSPARRMPFVLPTLNPSRLVLEGGGQLFVQPVVGGRRLDDVVGQRFAVFARDEESLDGTRTWWEDVVGSYVATLDDEPEFARKIKRWLDRAGADSVIVRPDRYVLWAGVDLAEASARVERVLLDDGNERPEADRLVALG